MDACTNVSDGKSKKQNSEGRQIGPPSGGESKRSQRGWASLLFRARPRLDGIVALRMTSIHLWGENVYSVTKKKRRTENAQQRNSWTSIPFKCIFTLWSEVVDVGLEMQLEDVVFMDVFIVRGDGDRVTQQRKTSKRVIILREIWNRT